MVSSTPWPHFTPGKDPVPILHEAGLAPGSVRTGGKSRPHRDSIPDRPAPAQSLYRLSYRAHINRLILHIKELSRESVPMGISLHFILRTVCNVIFMERNNQSKELILCQMCSCCEAVGLKATNNAHKRRFNKL